MPYSAVALGFAGLIPFIALPVMIMTGMLSLSEGARYFTQYSAVLLSFFGGVHWLDALQHNRTNHQLYVAMLPTIIGWLCLVFSGDVKVLGVLSVAYIAMLFYDKFNLILPQKIVVGYTSVRMVLTSVVVISHAVMIGILT
ncbi:DUF3429 domain-containing protein [Alteromonas sp. ASW11-19]|uniref:DUF3429 domain-containing protein n=1 Tax=Alteromonas salexigens TaxID=2982530 RepID=A0ABT2VN09_9ALTE|nr:DUF3429 domain-containing protein [Alteromonas salexigens]MCU7554273.1 DUF3429 domain-containing protein [Alteromonas salexigens]